MYRSRHVIGNKENLSNLQINKTQKKKNSYSGLAGMDVGLIACSYFYFLPVPILPPHQNVKYNFLSPKPTKLEGR